MKNINHPILLDGGLSTILEKLGYNLNHKLWSAKLLETNPDAITKAHYTYLKSGAQCITTSSYQASVDGFMDFGYDKPTAEKLILRSVELAELAIKQYCSTENNFHPLIAASIGPYGAYLADGSEYHGNYNISDNQLRKFHLDRIKLLDLTKADFFACETIPSFREAKILSEILNNTNKSAWISFSCKDEQHLNDGTKIYDCVKYLSDHSNIFAIGVNCTDPKYISNLIKSIITHSAGKKIVVYPNSGEAYNAKSKTWMGTSNPGQFVEMSKEWLELGADIIGGCCRIGPDHIKRINDVLFKTNR